MGVFGGLFVWRVWVRLLYLFGFLTCFGFWSFPLAVYYRVDISRFWIRDFIAGEKNMPGRSPWNIDCALFWISYGLTVMSRHSIRGPRKLGPAPKLIPIYVVGDITPYSMITHPRPLHYGKHLALICIPPNSADGFG